MAAHCRRRATAVMAALLLSASVVGTARAEAEQAADETGPRIEFEKLEHDFGHAVSGEPLKANFSFKNVGDDVLVIESVKGG